MDDHSRLAYSEILADQDSFTCTGFLRRAQAFYAAHGITVQRVLTDNGSGYISGLFAACLAASGGQHKRTRPYRPQTNGKVERFNRTLLSEWAYVRVYTSNQQRAAALQDWLPLYNHHSERIGLRVLHRCATRGSFQGIVCSSGSSGSYSAVTW